MPSKLQNYADLAETAAKQLTGSMENWTAFLTTAARLYKYPYHEQLMIYAQRQDATACADFDTWNKRMGRYVRRGSNGIALLDTTGSYPKLRYVFDVADTGAREKSRDVNLWTLDERHMDAVAEMLARNYDISGNDTLADKFEQTAAKLAAEYWQEHHRDIADIVNNSFLEEYDIDSLGMQFRSAAAVSITYSLMSRCGMNPVEHFEHEDFLAIFDFNAPDTIAALGTAVSDISEQVLRQIEVTVKNHERTHEHEERTELHESGRLQSPESDLAEAANAGYRQIREDASGVPEESPTDPVQPADPVGEAVPAPDRDRGDSEPEDEADDGRAGEAEQHDRESESYRSDVIGADDEQPESASRRNDSVRAGVQLSIFDAIPSEAEQIAYIDEAESKSDLPFAFSMGREEIDTVLRYGGNERDSRMRIAAEFMKEKSVEDHASFLQNLFNGGNGFKVEGQEIFAWYDDDGIHLVHGRTAKYAKSAQVIPCTDAAVRIGELLEQGRFASNV